MKILNHIFNIQFIVVLFTLFFSTLSIAQEDGKTMKSFVPKSKAYDIYYPKNYRILEDEHGIVSISDTISHFNITISNYNLSKKPSDVDLITMLNSFINETYKKNHTIQDWNTYKTKFDNLVVLKTAYENYNWVWFGINKKKSVVVISINKKAQVTEEDMNLIKFMIENMIIE